MSSNQNNVSQEKGDCLSQLNEAIASNANLLMVLEDLAAAIQTHRINTRLSTPADRVLWETLENLVVYED